MIKEYERVPHTADLKIRVYGVTVEELFVNAVKGMFASCRPVSSHITYQDEIPHVSHFLIERRITVQAPSKDLLLVDFLSECLYLCDIHNEVYLDAKIDDLSDTEITATLFGVPISGFDGQEIKAVTYHDLQLEQSEGIWQATLVFDC